MDCGSQTVRGWRCSVTAPELVDTARRLVGEGKGLLAMDESNATCDKRFAAVGIPQTHEAHCAYREMFDYAAPRELHQRRDS